MKHTGKCPKCGGTELLLIQGYGSGNIIPAGWSGAKVDRFLCRACGYSEEWIAPKDIAKLIQEMNGPGAEHISIYPKQEETHHDP